MPVAEPVVDPLIRGASVDLPDVNVWLALIHPQHAHHALARQYWEQTASARLAFCRVTMLGLLRLATNQVVMGGTPLSAGEAWASYQAVMDLPELAFASDPPGLERLMQSLTDAPFFKPADWTDAYLAAFAQSAGMRLVSFDKGFSRFERLDCLQLSDSPDPSFSD